MKRNYLLLFCLVLFATKSFSQEVKKISSDNKSKILRKNDAIQDFSKQLDNVRTFQPSGVIRCATTEHNKSLQNSKLAPSDEEFEKWLAPKVAEIKNKRNQRALPTTIVIPVVVHIIHNGDAVGTGENISLAQALSQIQVFNEDFGKLAGTPGDGAGVDTDIQFCLAQIDPNGNPTNGIVRHNLGAASFDSAAVEAAKAATIWDPTKYLNMWTFNFGGDLAGVLGYAQFPTGSGLAGMPTGDCFDDSGSGASTDGVVCSYDTWGSSSYATGAFNPPYDKGRTMTHEVGHMFGLRHIWGDGGCGVDDFCDDTPLSDAANFGCPTTNSCTDTPVDFNDQVQNYMDYTDDTCMNIFTQDQKDRMLAVLMNSPRRDDLLVSTVCTSSVLTPFIQFKRQDCEFRPVNEINEGSDCGGFTEFTIVLDIDKAPSANATVTFAVDGTSTANAADVQIMTPIITFPSGSTADQNLVIRVLHDGLVELDEDLVISFVVNPNGGDAVINPNGNIFTLKILNDDSIPTLTQTYNILDEDFEDASGWSTFDVDGDGRVWDLVTGLDGFGTTPNTLTGTVAFSEKRLTYLGGTGTANPVNNYIISPQITFPTSATSINLSYIVGAYDNTAATRNAGNFSVYFTTSIANEAAILAGTLVQANLVINENTTQLRTYNLMTTPNLMGQTGYLVFRHNNTSTTANVGLLLLDTVKIEVVKNTLVQTEVNTPTRYEALLNSNGSFYGYDDLNGNIIAGIINNTSSNYGCSTIEVNRSQTSVGNPTKAFIDTNVSNAILSKTYNITAANVPASHNYNVRLYFTEAEVAAWESATGKSRSELQIIKVQSNIIDNVNSTNYTTFTIEEFPATISAFGSNVVFEANFTSPLNGGYAVGPKTGINCGDISTIWNGSSWSNGVPSKVSAVTITGNYSSTANLDACSVTINNGANVVFNAGHTLIVNGNVTVNTGGSLTINNNAALRQIDNAAVNTGNIIVRRNSQPMIRQDYTAWSSPVIGQQLLAFSPNTVATRFYQYLYTGTTTPTAYQSVTPTTNFLAGKGYMIRVDNTWSSTVASSYNGQFTGVPTNGIVNQSTGIGYNLLGNPYASPIDADTFLADNTSIGTLYFWTNTTAASAGVYPQNNFAAYTTLGGTAAFGSGVIPNGMIQTGQGFYVQASAADVVDFNNAQRVNASTSTQFFRTSNQANTTVSAEKHRIWFNLNDANASYNQMLLGYMQGATNGFDNMIDGKVLDDTKPTLFNVVNADKYIIQGRSLPFTDLDVVPLGLKVVTPGTYSISIENVDGLFTSQDIFIKDKYNNTIHDVKQTPYSFSSQDGTFTDRFEVVYKNTLTNEDFVNENEIVVYSNQNEIVISASENIKEIIVFDVLGRKLYHNEKVNEKEFVVAKLTQSNQALLVKTTLTNGQSITKKVVF